MTMTMNLPSTVASSTRAALAFAAALLVAACSDDGASSAGTEASTATTEATGSTATTGATATTGESTGSTTDSTTGTGTDSATGTGSTGSTGSTSDTGAPVGVCEDDAGCKLVDSCCSCASVPIDTPDENCPGECFAPLCSAIGLPDPAADCRLGVCAIAPQRCDPNEVACDSLPPNCPEGQVASVRDVCWGACIDAHFCDVLPACTHSLCGPGWMCVDSQAGAFRPHCEPVPAACEGAPNCGCVGGAFAEVCAGGCSDDSNRLLCLDGG